MGTGEVGAVDRIFQVPQSVLDNPGQAAVDLISKFPGLDNKSTAISTLTKILKAAASGAESINAAAGSAVTKLAEDTLNSLYSGTTVNFGIRDDLKSFVGADYADIKPDGTFPNSVTFGGVPLMLKNSGTYTGNDDPSIFFGYSTAKMTSGAGEDLLFGFGQATMHAGAGDDLLLGTDSAKLYGDAGKDKIVVGGNATGDGGDGNDLLLAFQAVAASGGAGDDVVLGWKAQTIKKGDLLNPDEAPPQVGLPDLRPRAQQDLHMKLDGGEGNDWVIEIGGKGAETSGGLGRDLIFNSSTDGIVWGDVTDSILEVTSDRRFYLVKTVNVDGSVSTTKKWIADDATNADNFCWSPGATVMDPQKSDILTFFGIPLVGGADNGGVVLSLSGLGGVGTAIAAAQIFSLPINTIYIDQFLPLLRIALRRRLPATTKALTTSKSAMFSKLSSTRQSKLSAAIRRG